MSDHVTVSEKIVQSTMLTAIGRMMAVVGPVMLMAVIGWGIALTINDSKQDLKIAAHDRNIDELVGIQTDLTKVQSALTESQSKLVATQEIRTENVKETLTDLKERVQTIENRVNRLRQPNVTTPDMQ